MAGALLPVLSGVVIGAVMAVSVLYGVRPLVGQFCSSVRQQLHELLRQFGPLRCAGVGVSPAPARVRQYPLELADI